MNLFLYHFNNYYNRIVKKKDRLDEYGEPLAVQYAANFKERDGVNASCIINNTNAPYADYVVAADDEGEIVSRWFILENNKNREGQYELGLMRDVIVDYYDAVVKAPTFIEKATLGLNNPLIYNSENMTYNQIKEEEIPLKDKFGGPWIVGYIDRKTAQTTASIPAADVIVDYNLTDLQEYDYYEYTGKDFRVGGANDIKLGINCFHSVLFEHVDYTLGFDTNGNLANPGNREYLNFGISQTTPGKDEGLRIVFPKTIGEVQAQLSKEIKKQNWLDIDYSPYIESKLVDLRSEDGKIIKAGNDYYKIAVRFMGSKNQANTVSPASNLGLKLQKVTNAMTALEQGNEPYYLCNTQVDTYRLVFNPIAVDAIEVEIPGETDRIHCQDAPYDIFAIPYINYWLIYKGPTSYIGITVDKDISMKIAQEIQVQLGSQLYDLQLLPYCPLPPEVISKARIDLHYYGDNTKYASGITQTGEAFWKGAIFWLSNSNFQQQIVDVEIKAPTTALECKIMNETKIYRICSPNYSGVFEINAAKNKGLRNFIAYCTYKPAMPYIQVAPHFDGLYGKDFQDARGLICGGDFSLPRTQSAWIEYELQNKNYQLMFDRQIENLEINNNLARQEQIAGAITGALQAGGTAAVVGGTAAGPLGAAITGVSGAALSGVGGVIDYQMLIARQRETMDFTKDQFGYTLGNIGAQPTGLTRVSAFNINNKIFPFLEIYGATSEEEEALINKLTYNGMTVMTIGTIAQYIQEETSYIKGKVIRIDIEEDYHLALAASEEINKGVYI